MMSCTRVGQTVHWADRAGVDILVDDGAGEAAQLASAGHADAPAQLRLVARAFPPDLEALGTIGSFAVAGHGAAFASPAVLARPSGGTSSLARARFDGSGGGWGSIGLIVGVGVQRKVVGSHGGLWPPRCINGITAARWDGEGGGARGAWGRRGGWERRWRGTWWMGGRGWGR